MAVRRPTARVHSASSLTPVLEEQSGRRIQRSSTKSRIRARGVAWQRQLLRPDIDGCVVISKLRIVVALVSLTLLVSDIPRTGLGVRRLEDYYGAQITPSASVRFGPFDYPVIHVRRLDSGRNNCSTATTGFTGRLGAKPISAARVWYYQYDTTSIGLRGAVELLNVSEFPVFLLSKDDAKGKYNAGSLMGLDTTFYMLDAFISAAQTQLLPELTTAGTTPASLRFATQHFWIDRLHHYLLRFFSRPLRWRIHSLHVPLISNQTRSLSICSPSATSKHSIPRPRFCNHPATWTSAHPINASLRSVPVSSHMELRFQELQQRYPDLTLDVAVISTQIPRSTSGVFTSTHYSYEALEVVMLTRGRWCVHQNADSTPQCQTVFVDDFRYERDIVQTDVMDWYATIAAMRGSAQCYVWIRLALLLFGAYTVSVQQVAGRRHGTLSIMYATVSTVLKIPVQAVVYGSAFPIAGYVLALVLDGNFMDIFLDSYWSAVGGSTNFELLKFLESTAVQMRNVWLLALLANVLLTLVKRARYDSNEGVLGVRGLTISFTSMLTIFGPYKSVSFRNSANVNVLRFLGAGPAMDIVRSQPTLYFNSSSYIFDDSVAMLGFCLGFVATLALALKMLGYLTPYDGWFNRINKGIVLKSMPIVPCGTEALWPASGLIIHFHVPTKPPKLRATHTGNVAVAPSPTVDLIPAVVSSSIRLSLQVTVWPWRSRVLPKDLDTLKGIRQAQPPGGLRSRTTETQSIIQLTNVAMMTDPFNLFWLHVCGIQLYLYRIKGSRQHTTREANCERVVVRTLSSYRIRSTRWTSARTSAQTIISSWTRPIPEISPWQYSCNAARKSHSTTRRRDLYQSDWKYHFAFRLAAFVFMLLLSLSFS